MSIARQVARTVATARGKAESRGKLIAAVRAAARRKGLDDEARRDLQLRVTGKRSLGDMDLPEIGRVLDEMNRGWRAPSGDRAWLPKVRALWWTLYWLGEIDCEHGHVERALDRFVRRQAGVEALSFLTHRNAPAVVEALKDWAARAGVDWPGPEHWPPADVLAGDLPPQAWAERLAVIVAIGRRLAQAGVIAWLAAESYAAAALGLPDNPRLWGRAELDGAIRLLGKRLRRARGRAHRVRTDEAA